MYTMPQCTVSQIPSTFSSMRVQTSQPLLNVASHHCTAVATLLSSFSWTWVAADLFDELQLHNAAFYAVVQLLLDAGANTSATDLSDEIPLHKAACHCFPTSRRGSEYLGH
jgi:hypothetical protein